MTKISKINIESNDPTLRVDINKTPTSYRWLLVGVLVILAEAIYLLFVI